MKIKQIFMLALVSGIASASWITSVTAAITCEERATICQSRCEQELNKTAYYACEAFKEEHKGPHLACIAPLEADSKKKSDLNACKDACDAGKKLCGSEKK